jgi:hypothetical protein
MARWVVVATRESATKANSVGTAPKAERLSPARRTPATTVATVPVTSASRGRIGASINPVVVALLTYAASLSSRQYLHDLNQGPDIRKIPAPSQATGLRKNPHQGGQFNGLERRASSSEKPGNSRSRCRHCRAIADRCPKRHVTPAATPRSAEHAALGAPVRRTQARPRPP